MGKGPIDPKLPEIPNVELPILGKGNGGGRPVEMNVREVLRQVGNDKVLDVGSKRKPGEIFEDGGKTYRVMDDGRTVKPVESDPEMKMDPAGAATKVNILNLGTGGALPLAKVSPVGPGVKILGGFNKFVQGIVEDGGYNVQAAFDPSTGAVEFRAFDLGTGTNSAVGRLYKGANGETIFVGAYDKPIRNFFKLNGIQEPNAFVLPGRTEGQTFLPDDILIAEMQKYFGEIFGPTKKYTPRTYYVEGADHQGYFQNAVRRFFGENIQASRRWAPNGPYSDILGKYEVIPTDGILLENGGRLFPNGTVMTPQRDYILPASKTETAYTELALPQKLPQGTIFTMVTPGLSAPGNASARPTHKLMYFYDPVKKKTVAVSVDLARSVYQNVDVFAISHHHADHFNPDLVKKQLEYNSGEGRTTTLLMTEDVANTVLRDLARSEGWKADSTQYPDPEMLPPAKGRRKYDSYLDFLNDKGLKVKVEQTFTIGDVHVKMVPGYEGAHGPAQAGVAVIRKGEAKYWDPSDGDFDLASIHKQIQKWKNLPQEITALKTKDHLTVDEAKTLKGLEADLPQRDKMLNDLERTRKYLLQADVVDVDQGTSGFDTHGTDKTVRNLRQARLEKSKYPKLSEDQMNKTLDMAEQGRWDEIKGFLIGLKWPGEKVRTAVEIELKGVRPTHNLGYGSRFALPQVREGRSLEMEKDGRALVHYPKLEADFTAAGLKIIPDSKVNSYPKGHVAEVEFEGARYFIDRSNEQDFTHGIKAVVEKYSATDVAFTPTGPVSKPYFDLQSMTIQGVPVTEVKGWTKEPLEFTANKAPAPTNEDAFTYLDKRGQALEEVALGAMSIFDSALAEIGF